jgi:DNA polymerase elongation subunit (family B)
LSDIEEHDLGDLAAYAEMVTKRQKWFNKPSDDVVAGFKALHPLGWVSEEELKAKKKGEKQYSYWKNWKVATNLNVSINGFRFDFGTGGIHGSIESTIVDADDNYSILDCDVSSMYPNIAIANRIYPEHLSEKFCDIYQDVYEQRKSYAKNTAENAMLKLALNGVYGDSNNKYSPFYDPQYTMSITINGQLSLCLLAEKLMDIEGLQMLQVNTDGIVVKLPRNKRDQYDRVCDLWQKQVGLQLEYAEYSKLIARDCNNYIAVYTDGKVKRKGAYQYEGLGWHQDQGGLVIPKAAEAAMLQGIPLDVYIKGHKNKYDFMLRAKVPRSSKLVMVMGDGTEVVQQNTCRYYACNAGGSLVKVMPPLKEEAEPRRIGIGEGYGMWTCNDVNDFTWKDVDYQYYIDAAEKLVIQ